MKQLLEQQLLHTDRLQYLAAAEAIKTAAKADREFNRECIRAQRECAKEFRRTIISKTQEGFYLMTTEDPLLGKLVSNRLTSSPMDAIICWAFETNTQILKIFSSGKDTCIPFREYPDVGQFMMALDKLGICLSVSTRRKKEAAELLLSFLINSVPKKEISFSYGWNKHSDGGWHFADEDQEVLLTHVNKCFS